MRLLIICIFSFFQFVIPVTWAAGDVWMNIGLGSASVNSLVIDPTNSNTIYAGIYNIQAGNSGSGLYKSIDGGGSWKWMANTNSAISSVVIDYSNTTTIYLGLNSVGAFGTSGSIGGVYKSTDGGVSWNLVGNGLTVASGSTVGPLVIDPSNPATLYVATSTGTYGIGALYKSTNGGVSWSSISSGLNATTIYTLAVDPSNSARIYAGTNGGIYLSTNGGASWSLTNNSIKTLNIYSLVINKSNPTTIYAGTYGSGAYQSTDGGISWSQINNGLPNYTNVNVLSINPSTPATIYAGTNGGVYLSINGGGSWIPDSSGIGYTYNINSLAIDPLTPSVIYAGTYGVGTYKSNQKMDCIFNWAEKSYPQYFSPAGAVDTMSTPYAYRYYYGTSNYLAISSADNNLYVYGSVFGGLLKVGLASSLSGTAGCS